MDSNDSTMTDVAILRVWVLRKAPITEAFGNHARGKIVKRLICSCLDDRRRSHERLVSDMGSMVIATEGWDGRQSEKPTEGLWG